MSKILWFTWKDTDHPEAGGAEIVNEELAKRLVQDGCEVVFVAGGFLGCQGEESRDGYKIIRLGNKYTLYPRACIYYRQHLRSWPDLIIEEVNTVPFLTQVYAAEKKILFIHQLCREIWFYQQRFPLSLIGYFLEPIWLFILRNLPVVTVSQSTKKDLQKYGFKSENIRIITEGNELTPIKEIDENLKYPKFTLLSLGGLRSMKKVQDQIKAFEIAKRSLPNLQLKIVGKAYESYGQKILKMIANNPYANDIEYLGYLSPAQKQQVLKQSHLILSTSVKEGWGLTITEAASQGTPALVYNVDGLRDSVWHNASGIICEKNTPDELAAHIVALSKNKKRYGLLRRNAWELSKKMTFDQSYRDFKKIINNYIQ